VVLHQLCANSSASRAAIKTAVLPNPWQPSSVSSSSQSSARSAPSPAQAAAVDESGADSAGTSVVPAVRSAAMDPTDAPPDSLRGRLLRHMTSLDSQLKRCVAEFLFLLCGEDGESHIFSRFVYRVLF
jgi:hypothetical protein